MITDETIDKALDWLVKNARPAAQARANRIYMDEYRKSLKAILMSASVETTEAGKERWAYANAKYVEHLNALRDAVEQDEWYRWMTTAAEAKIECWRSEQANQRAQSKVG